LNANKILKIPLTFNLNPNLKIVDFGNNFIGELNDLQPLSSLNYLKNLNLKGNPVCNKPDYKEQIQKMLPQLKLLDGEPLLHRRKRYLKQKKRNKSNEIKPKKKKLEHSFDEEKKFDDDDQEKLVNKKRKTFDVEEDDEIQIVKNLQKQ